MLRLAQSARQASAAIDGIRVMGREVLRGMRSSRVATRWSANASRAVSAAISASFSAWLSWAGTGSSGTRRVTRLGHDRVKNFLTPAAEASGCGLTLGWNKCHCAK
jgi:hypothetical protein